MIVGSTNFQISHFKLFFTGKLEYLDCEMSNPETEKRLQWLSEGSLRYHMTQFESDFPLGGCPEEKELYREFIEFVESGSRSEFKIIFNDGSYDSGVVAILKGRGLHGSLSTSDLHRLIQEAQWKLMQIENRKKHKADG